MSTDRNKLLVILCKHCRVNLEEAIGNILNPNEKITSVWRRQYFPASSRRCWGTRCSNLADGEWYVQYELGSNQYLSDLDD